MNELLIVLLVMVYFVCGLGTARAEGEILNTPLDFITVILWPFALLTWAITGVKNG